jgi:hypothetical protein
MSLQRHNTNCFSNLLLGGVREKDFAELSKQQAFSGDLLGGTLPFALGVLAVPDI